MNQPIAALRTPQIDANYLDDNFEAYNWEIFSSLFRSFHSTWIHSLKHEFQLFLRLMTSYNTLLSSSSTTIGQQLLQVKYSPLPMTRRQRFLYLLSLFLSYIYEKYLVDLRRFLPVQFVYQSMSLINFLFFLYRGTYPKLFDRFASLLTVHNHPPSLRILDYSYMKRELIWHTLNETLGTVIPFLTSFRARLLLRKYSHGVLMKSLVQSNQCSVCDQTIVMPYESVGECKHYFCYVCAYSLIEQSCPICFKTIYHIRPKEFEVAK